MTKFKAIYRNGRIEPSEHIDLREGTEVEINVMVEEADKSKGSAPHSAADRARALAGTMSKAEAEEFDRLIDDEFGQIDDDF